MSDLISSIMSDKNKSLEFEDLCECLKSYIQATIDNRDDGLQSVFLDKFQNFLTKSLECKLLKSSLSTALVQKEISAIMLRLCKHDKESKYMFSWRNTPEKIEGDLAFMLAKYCSQNVSWSITRIRSANERVVSVFSDNEDAADEVDPYGITFQNWLINEKKAAVNATVSSEVKTYLKKYSGKERFLRAMMIELLMGRIATQNGVVEKLEIYGMHYDQPTISRKLNKIMSELKVFLKKAGLGVSSFEM